MSEKSRSLRIHLAPDALEALKLGDTDTLSGRIAEVARRFWPLVQASIPDLTTREWCAIFDVLNGAHMVPEMNESMGVVMVNSADGMVLSMADSPEMGEKWDIDHLALVRKLDAMSVAQRIAVAEVARCFWVKCAGYVESWGAAVTMAKAGGPPSDGTDTPQDED